MHTILFYDEDSVKNGEQLLLFKLERTSIVPQIGHSMLLEVSDTNPEERCYEITGVCYSAYMASPGCIEVTEMNAFLKEIEIK
jgi:hypothetical protein